MMQGYFVDSYCVVHTLCKLFYNIQYMRINGSSQPTCMEINFFYKKSTRSHNNRCKLITAAIVHVCSHTPALHHACVYNMYIYENCSTARHSNFNLQKQYHLIVNSWSFAIFLGCITEFQVFDSGIHCCSADSFIKEPSS